MELDWGYFRQLYGGLLDHDDGLGGPRAYLSGQRSTVADHLAELEPLRKRERIPAGGYTANDEQLWRIMKLYGLSRVSDYLIERSCTHPGFGVTAGRAVGKGGVANGPESEVHTEFFSGVGLTPFDHAEAFSPFHHEVFAVVQDPSATSVTVEEVLWPGLWFGDLLFSRAGVRVRAPQHLLDATAATTSTLYFTFRRQPRPTDDLSHGWGSNSQWRTCFPRFYSDEEGLHFNWDGEVDIAVDPPAPRAGWSEEAVEPLDQRRELLLHRCFVRDPLPADEHDRDPYSDRLSLVAAEWPLRPESIVRVRWAK
ncbi:hypothetical protein [Kibdelosporangium phytohabitans]|uniref:Uncharacterized protein n=1 Tax=Kibdelosporangium phytohabitans TaxID=860235 RepID=A0A0N9I5R3_9PSEU|nr:hypothetical protein [Kibdelosporangium phytohabitans]ALG09762.1 hypothetical protein AOZ06_25230 [Kibdelosporangium phytohabitans]MBE1468867.1 hypothetical protein [Kibdelosporangium phytohabitans]